jgi:hypothetical protein
MGVSVSFGAGFVHNENFVVLTEATISQQATQDYAQSVLKKAEEYRKQIAIEWFGEELPPGIGRSTINVRYTSDQDSGLTWAADNPERKLHTIYLQTRADSAEISTLAHEMAHVVMATMYPHPNRLPAWVEEGIASQYDNAARKKARNSALRFFAKQENWPQIDGVLTAHNISAEDTRAYTVAVSLTEMLLKAGGKRTFLEFGRAAGRDGVEKALARYYQVRSLTDLQTRWQSWVTQTMPRETLSLNESAR